MRLLFLDHSASELANPDPSLLNAVATELLGPLGAVRADSAELADAILLNEPWAFREWRYIDRLAADPIVGRYPHKTYTINVDDAPTGVLRGAYTSLSRQLFDPALHVAVPYSLETNEFVLAEAGPSRPPPTHLATWRGNTKSNRRLREALVRRYRERPGFLVETTESWMNHDAQEKRRYVDLLRSGKFSLCPAGWAASTFRVYESMALGVAPVVIADDFVLPSGPPWEAISVRIAESDIGRLAEILQGAEERSAEMGRLAHQHWYRLFSPAELPRYYASQLMRLISVTRGTGSRESEMQRWRSRKTYVANHWTLPQRARRRIQRLLKL